LSPQRLEFTAVRALGRQICQEFNECCRTSDLIIESLALETLFNCMRSSRRGRRRTPPWLTTVVEFANDRFAESFTLEEISGLVGVHPMHLARQFHMRLGCTLGEFLRRIRLSRARAQMATKSKPLAEIAIECGFADQSHLTRLFSKAFGLSPARYRRSL
jgi:AraC family transcriptional regulator